MNLYIDQMEKIDVKQLLTHLIVLGEKEWKDQLKDDLQQMSISFQLLEQNQVKLCWMDHKSIRVAASENISIEIEEFLKRHTEAESDHYEEILACVAILIMLQYFKITTIYITPHNVTKMDINRIDLTGLQVQLIAGQEELTPASSSSSTGDRSNGQIQPSMLSIIKFLHSNGKIRYIQSSDQLEMNINKHLSFPITDETPGSIILFTSIVYDSPSSHHIEHIDPDMMLLQSNIDDMNPELFPYIIQLLFDQGANDVFLQPIIMKKGRMGTMLQVLCHQRVVKEMKSLIFRETTTLGIRQVPIAVHRLARESIEVETEWGKIGIKIARMSGEVVQVSPEYEDCKIIAEKYLIPIQKVFDRVKVELEKGGYDETRGKE